MTALRKTQFPGNRDITELAGDVQRALAAIVPFSVATMTEVYAEPMTLQLDHAPKAVLAIDVREDAAPEQAIPVSAVVNFTAIAGGVRINSIEGPSLGTRYRYVFLTVGRR